MDLSPNDIRNYEFNTQMRGYDKEEVESLLDQVATAWEDAKQDNLKLSMEIDSLKSQIDNLKQFEDTIKKAAIDARRSADETMAKAKEEASKIMADAEREAAEMVGSKVHEVEHLKNQIEELEQTKRSFISELRKLILQHQDLIDEIASSDVKKELSSHTSVAAMSASEPTEHNDSNGFDITDSTDVTRDKIETLAKDGSDDDYDDDDNNDSGEIPTMEQPQQEPQPAQKFEAPQEEAPVDDELAAALSNYHADSNNAQPQMPAAPAPGQFVETNKKAEDVPDEFIPVGEVKTSDPNADTDRVQLQHRHEPAVAEDIAAELDSVVAKFEEEMDKAEKS